MKLRRRRNYGPLEVLHGDEWVDWKSQSIPAAWRKWLSADHHSEEEYDRFGMTLYSGRKFTDLEAGPR